MGSKANREPNIYTIYTQTLILNQDGECCLSILELHSYMLFLNLIVHVYMFSLTQFGAVHILSLNLELCICCLSVIILALV